MQRLGCLSPDGRYMSYTDWTSKLCVRDPVTGTDRCPTNTEPGGSPGYGEDSSFSSDGHQIAYVWRSIRSAAPSCG